MAMTCKSTSARLPSVPMPSGNENGSRSSAINLSQSGRKRRAANAVNSCGLRDTAWKCFKQLVGDFRWYAL
eukprot:9979283-Alexandrium_andersonii.AAC.1